MYCKNLSTSEIAMRSSASLPQHLVNIPHVSTVTPNSTFPLGMRGRSPSAILDLTFAVPIFFHINSPVSIWVLLIVAIASDAAENIPLRQRTQRRTHRFVWRIARSRELLARSIEGLECYYQGHLFAILRYVRRPRNQRLRDKHDLQYSQRHFASPIS